MTPRRIQRRRTKGWRMPPDTVSVTRSGRYGNPFVIGSAIRRNADGVVLLCTCIEDTVAAFRMMAEQKYASDPAMFEPLRGKNLACWCAEDAEHCHADVLLEIANRPAAPRRPNP